jgi:hypothetical protein
VPETVHTARDLPVCPRQVARHDPRMTLRLIYQVFTTLLGWIVLRSRSDTTKDIGEPPRFRIPDPIRSGPERRKIYARTAQEVHT